MTSHHVSAGAAQQAAGESVNLEALTVWLGSRTELAGQLTAEPLGAGRSNLSYLLGDGRRRFVLRRPPFGDLLAGAHDVIREYRLLEGLQGSGVPVVETIAACEDSDVLGAPFTVVGYVDGITLRSGHDLTQLSARGRRRSVREFGRTLARLHAVPPERSGRPAEKGRDYATRQLNVWRRQLAADPFRPVPAMDLVADELAASVPEQDRVAIVHGDYRLDNALLSSEGDVRAVIDWELWSLGDPAADLGSAIAYWTDSPFEPAPLGETPTGSGELGTRHDLLAAYEGAGGTVPERRRLRWHVAFGLWRFAAILEGVYRRNLAGAYGERGSQDWRRLEHVVPVLAASAAQVLDSTAGEVSAS